MKGNVRVSRDCRQKVLLCVYCHVLKLYEVVQGPVLHLTGTGSQISHVWVI